jgi:hypothetical protein
VTERDQSDPKGYGNIYTPHAGSMIIAVQREGGLASRTIVLSERKVKLLRLLMSRTGVTLVSLLVASWVFFGVEAARVPALQRSLARHDRDAARLDTLEFTLTQLQKRYEQVQHMLGVSGPAAMQRPDLAAPARQVASPPNRAPTNPETVAAPAGDSSRAGPSRTRDATTPASVKRPDTTRARDSTRIRDTTRARDTTTTPDSTAPRPE